MSGRTSCEDCKKAYAPSGWDDENDKNRKQAGPPCGRCAPPIMPGNADAFSVYLLCSDQWIVQESGAVGMLIPSIESAMRIKRISIYDREDCLDRVLTMARIVVKSRNEKSKALMNA